MAPALARRLPLSVQLIGVDGGATEVKVHEVEVVERGGETELIAGARSSRRTYERVQGFATPRARGLRSAAGLGEITPPEREQAFVWIESAARSILDVAKPRAAVQVLVGIAMPGAKSADGRGIDFAFNGPRVPEFVSQLEDRLANEGVVLAAPIGRLLSDGWCCGMGEEWAEGGLFRGIDDAYYVGGGTGVAEALKLAGRVVPLDELEPWFRKAWQLFDELGEDVEQLLSVRGINARCGCDDARTPASAARAFPEQRARHDEHVQTVLGESARALARLVLLRVIVLHNRFRHDVTVRATGLGRVVVGQRLAQLLADPRTHEHFDSVVRSELCEGLARLRGDGEFWASTERIAAELAHPLVESLREARWLSLSPLRAAPAIGAAAAALIEWSRAHG